MHGSETIRLLRAEAAAARRHLAYVYESVAASERRMADIEEALAGSATATSRVLDEGTRLVELDDDAPTDPAMRPPPGRPGGRRGT